MSEISRIRSNSESAGRSRNTSYVAILQGTSKRKPRGNFKNVLENIFGISDGVQGDGRGRVEERFAVSFTPTNENSVFDDKQRKDVIRKLSAVAKQNGVARLDKDSFVTDAMGILERALDTGIVSDGIVELIFTFMF